MDIEFKRGQRIIFTYAGGRAVPGKIVRFYTAKEIALHAKSHGVRAAELLPNWIVCELTDESGSYRGACHIDQLRAAA
jgi:hypothetical protein